MATTPKPVSFTGQFKDTPAAEPQPPAATAAAGFEATIVAREVQRVRAAAEGQRNETLNQAAFNLAQVLPADTFMQQLAAAGYDVGLTEPEVSRTIRSGIRGGQRNPRPPERQPRPAAPYRTPSGPVETLPALDGYQEPNPAPEALYVDWDELWADTTETEWLAEPIIPAGRLVSIYSPPGVGKSLLALDLAAAIARGGPILGQDTRQAPVLYLDYENVTHDVRDRLKSMGLGPDDLRALHYWSFPAIPALDTEPGGRALHAAARATQARLVVIDTLSRCITGDENDAATMLAFYRHTLMPLKADGIAVLRLDHTGKDETKGQRGTSAKSGDVDLVWRYSEMIPGIQFVLTNEKHRIRIDELTLNIRREDQPLRHVVDTRTIGQAKTEAILRALDTAGLPRSAGRDRARHVLTAAGIKVRDTTLATILKDRQAALSVPEEDH